MLNQRALVVDARSLPKGEWGKRLRDFQTNLKKQIAAAEKEYLAAMKALKADPTSAANINRIRAAAERQLIVTPDRINMQAFFRTLILESGGG